MWFKDEDRGSIFIWCLSGQSEFNQCRSAGLGGAVWACSVTEPEKYGLFYRENPERYRKLWLHEEISCNNNPAFHYFRVQSTGNIFSFSLFHSHSLCLTLTLSYSPSLLNGKAVHEFSNTVNAAAIQALLLQSVVRLWNPTVNQPVLSQSYLFWA